MNQESIEKQIIRKQDLYIRQLEDVQKEHEKEIKKYKKTSPNCWIWS